MSIWHYTMSCPQSNEDSLHEMKLQSKVVEELFAEKTCHMNSAQRDMTEQKIKITHAKEATSSLIRKTRLQQSMQVLITRCADWIHRIDAIVNLENTA